MLVPLKCPCIPLLVHALLNLFPSPCMYGTTMKVFLLLLLLLDPLLLLLLGWLTMEPCPLLMLCLQLNLCCSFLSVHGGKLQTCKAFLMCSNSLHSVCWLVDTTLAPCPMC